MKRFVAVLSVAASLLFFVLNGLNIEDDPIASLGSKNLVHQSLFNEFHKDSIFKSRVFLDTSDLSLKESDALSRTMDQGGYRRVVVKLGVKEIEQILHLAPLLPLSVLESKLAEDHARKRADEVYAMMAMPGSGDSFSAVLSDPLNLSAEIAARVTPDTARDPAAKSNRTISIFQTPPTMNYNRIEPVYRALEKLGSKVKFIGGDFFSYEDYRAIQDDIILCTVVSILVNLVLFLGFCPNWRLLAFLVAGSALSYLTGLATVKLFYPVVFALVLGFTSTFIGFNNEYLIHLSGLSRTQLRASLTGLGSAIGTTLIGFIVLLFADSAIIKQIALVSIGGMVGFVALMLIYQDKLRSVNIRPLQLPFRSLTKKGLIAVWCAVAAIFAIVGEIPFKTSVDDFKYSTPMLEDQVSHFQSLDTAIPLTSPFATEVSGDWLSTYRRLPPHLWHPLRAYVPEATQGEAVKLISLRYPSAVNAFLLRLKALGVELDSPIKNHLELTALSPDRYLQLIAALSPIPWYIKNRSGNFLVFYSSKLLKEVDGVPLGPKTFYNDLLTDLSKSMATLFGVGILLMAAYLVPVQRDPWKLAYIFAPLFLGAAAILAFLKVQNATANFIHVTGFALVIALAVDYAAISISSGFSSLELSKVTMTGLSTLASFGALFFAKHPVLRDLGATVTIGAGVALTFTLLFRYRAGPNEAREGGYDATH